MCLNMEREIIYGVCDKTGTCDSYFGFFKKETDAIKEVATQAGRLKEELGIMKLTVNRDMVTSDTDGKLLIVIHKFVLR